MTAAGSPRFESGATPSRGETSVGGDTFTSENVPGIAVERDRVIASGLTRRIDGHTYRQVIQIHEHATTPKPAEVELKTYAPGTGVITEANGELHLVRCF